VSAAARIHRNLSQSDCRLWRQGASLGAAKFRHSRHRRQEKLSRQTLPLVMLMPPSRGLNSSTFQLNLSAFFGIGDASRGSLGVFLRCFGGIRGV